MTGKAARLKQFDPALIGSGRERIPEDDYPTIDDRVVSWLDAHFPLTGLHIWEPACGDGTMVRSLERHGAKVVLATDIKMGFDFLAPRRFLQRPQVDLVCTNPPYSGDKPEQFVRRALRLAPAAWVIMLFRHEWICAKGRRDLFLDLRFFAKGVLDFRPFWFEGGRSPRHPFAWLVWCPAGMDHGGPFLWV